MDSRRQCLNTSKTSCKNHTGPADWLSLHSTIFLPCLVRRCTRSNGPRGHLPLPRRINRKNIRYAHVLARHLLSCSCDICYRGCNLHLLGFSARVESNVISFLIAQIICFLPISLCPNMLVIILSHSLTLKNPSAFSLA